MTLDTHTAVVTGGTNGVGRGVAAELARAGARVFVTGRSADERADAASEVTGIRCDRREDAQVDAAFERILREAGAIDSRSGAGTGCSTRACAHTIAPASWPRRR